MTTSHQSGTATGADSSPTGSEWHSTQRRLRTDLAQRPGRVPFVVLFLILLAPRLLHVAAPFEAAFAAMMLTATCACQQHWYVTVS